MTTPVLSLQPALPGLEPEESRPLVAALPRVLIAERDDELRKALLRALVLRGFDVTATALPEIALRIAKFVEVAVIGDVDEAPGARYQGAGTTPKVIALAAATPSDADVYLASRDVDDILDAVESVMRSQVSGHR